MQIAQLTLTDAFKVLFSVRQVQAAENGDCTWRGRRRARQSPPRCDQWLYVVDGTGEAVVEGQTHALQAGSLIAIERGETHEIRNTGNTPLKTVNFYHPPAYDAQGEPLPAGEAQ